MGGVFPGAASPAELWAHVRAGRDAAREVPPGRWLLPKETAYDPRGGTADRVYSTRGCFIETIPPLAGLKLPSGLAEGLDPLFHLVLHAGFQAWGDCVTKPLDRGRVGVLIGNIALPTEKSSALAREYLGRTFEEKLLGASKPLNDPTDPRNRFVAGLPAGLLSKALGLGGGSLTLDAACASSLYALKLASEELLAGRADAMLAGGASRPDCLYTQMGFSQLRALSPSGRCAPFDARADGLVVGEGAGIFVLKRLSDALRDGDRIYATIRGFGLSNDIQGSLLAPNSEGQLRALHAAYAQAGWSPANLDLIECHATGTPIGDAVEFASLVELFGAQATKQQCVIGSVKSNVGHLLTGAGAAGLTKVLFAMREGVLPPTANFESAAPKLGLEQSPFRVLRAAEEWKRRAPGQARRAAVTGFGFGGINAHMLLEEWLPENALSVKPKPATKPTRIPIAIVGMEAHFGPWENLRAFQERVLGIAENVAPHLPRHWWGLEGSAWFKARGATPPTGYFLDEVKLPLGRFRIPPKELEELLPQQALMLCVAAAALEDAGLDGALGTDTGIFVGLELDPNTTNFQLRWALEAQSDAYARQLDAEVDDTARAEWSRTLRDASGPALSANRTMGALGGIVASRIAREFKCGGPSFTLSSEESSGLRALEMAVRALQRGELKRALCGAVDLAGDPRAALPQAACGAGNANIFGEGAAAVVLKRLDDAERDGDRIYAVIDGLGTASGSFETASRQALERACSEAATPPGALQYLETPRGIPLGHAATESPCALGNVNTQIGHAGAASGFAALVKTALCLFQEIIPPNPEAQIAKAGSACFAPAKPQYWLRNRADGPRRAGVLVQSTGGTCVQVLLSGIEVQPAAKVARVELERHQPLGARSEALFVVAGANAAEVLEGLQALRAHAENFRATNVEALARSWFALQRHKESLPLAAALVARSAQEVSELCAAARELVQNPAAKPTRNAERVFYSATPLGREGRVAFVYPGSGNHFVDMGRVIGVEWPAVFRKQDRENEALRAQYVPEIFWNRTRPEEPNSLLLGQVALGTLTSDLLSRFGVRPSMAIGYSLGVSASYFGLRIWHARDEMLRRMHISPLFVGDLGGPFEAAREFWQRKTGKRVDWSVGVLSRSPAEIRAALGGLSEAYLLIINSAEECVIGGERASVETLAKKLNAPIVPVGGVTIAHCGIVRPVADAYRALHHFDVTRPDGVRFYSGVDGKRLELSPDACANAVLEQALQTVDFPRVAEGAYADGARIFVEMGPGTSCARMLRKIFAGRPHRVAAVCASGQDDTFSLLRTLAMLISERIPVDLAALYDIETKVCAHAKVPAAERVGEFLRLSVGGEPFHMPPLPQRAHRTEARATRGATPQPARQSSAAALALEAEAGVVAIDPAEFLELMSATEATKLAAHEQFLRFSADLTQTMAANIELQLALLAQSDAGLDVQDTAMLAAPPLVEIAAPALDRAQCMEFAIGSIGKVLGAEFAAIDAHPTRVRLPDAPLMLVDRIMSIEGEARAMGAGRVLTEHDVLHNGWYLDGGRIPTCIAVEAGQADLFLSGYLGIDFITKGLAVYRLLDAVVTFHRSLPEPGAVIKYDIRIERFFRQGETWLFKFNFESTVDGAPLLTMKNGCAGFFTQGELAAGQGIVHTKLDLREIPGVKPSDWSPPVPLANERYSAEQLDALRNGDLGTCFGPAFAELNLRDPLRLPGGKMRLVHRVMAIEPNGGRFGLGKIRAEADIHPEDWFLTCHFSDDPVMPGTLMYECCLHTLRILLLRMGWVGEQAGAWYEPVPGVASQLKCRGQVIESTKVVTYEVTLKEYGFGPEPFAIADALMYADGKPIVEIINMSVRLMGVTRAKLDALWSTDATSPQKTSNEPRYEIKPASYGPETIRAFAIGKPSDAFGEAYKIFDAERVIARLPGPPYQFLDRITEVRAPAWEMTPGGEIEAQYDVPADEWYFDAHPGQGMPFAVLLEVALQPCGWLAAYMGSALRSPTDVSFRNLGGSGVQHTRVGPDIGTLTTAVKCTKISTSGGMIIQHYDYELRSRGALIYSGDTYFGFFSKQALAQQIGIRDAKRCASQGAQETRIYPHAAPYPGAQLRMLDRVVRFEPRGGAAGLGFLQGEFDVDPQTWFFKAHFHQDPVCPGSLGLESFLQLLAFAGRARWGEDVCFQQMALKRKHQWIYRGQVIPQDKLVTVETEITACDDAHRALSANGFLLVDGRVIYQMLDFTIEAL